MKPVSSTSQSPESLLKPNVSAERPMSEGSKALIQKAVQKILDGSPVFFTWAPADAPSSFNVSHLASVESQLEAKGHTIKTVIVECAGASMYGGPYADKMPVGVQVSIQAQDS